MTGTRVLLLSPRTNYGRRLQRSYAGGLGTVNEAAEECLLPPYELMRIAGLLRADGFEPTVVDEEVTDDPPASADVVVVWVNLPSLAEDRRRLAAYRDEGIRCYAYTSIRQRATWRELIERDGCAAVILPEGVGQVAALLRGDEAHGTVTPATIADPKHLGGDFVPLGDEPLPARDLVDHAPYSFPGLGDRDVTTSYASFGCPYPCAFYCPYPLSEGNRVRAYAVERVVAEFRQCVEMGIAGIVFRDPVFSIHRRRTMALCEALREADLGLPWSCETRVDRLDEELIAAMAAAGCVCIETGVESGDARMQDGAVRKHIDLEAVRRLYRAARANGISVTSLFVIGLPGETRRSIANTLEFVLDLELSIGEYDIGTITPYPGTPLEKLASERAWIRPAEFDQFTSYDPLMTTDTLTVEELREAMGLVAEMRRIASLGPKEHPRFRAALAEWAGAVPQSVG